jgi:hypothetical protein
LEDNPIVGAREEPRLTGYYSMNSYSKRIGY